MLFEVGRELVKKWLTSGLGENDFCVSRLLEPKLMFVKLFSSLATLLLLSGFSLGSGIWTVSPTSRDCWVCVTCGGFVTIFFGKLRNDFGGGAVKRVAVRFPFKIIYFVMQGFIDLRQRSVIII